MSREFLEAMIYLNNGINEKRVSFLQYLEYKSKVGDLITVATLFFI